MCASVHPCVRSASMRSHISRASGCSLHVMLHRRRRRRRPTWCWRCLRGGAAACAPWSCTAGAKATGCCAPQTRRAWRRRACSRANYAHGWRGACVSRTTHASARHACLARSLRHIPRVQPFAGRRGGRRRRLPRGACTILHVPRARRYHPYTSSGGAVSLVALSSAPAPTPSPSPSPTAFLSRRATPTTTFAIGSVASTPTSRRHTAR